MNGAMSKPTASHTARGTGTLIHELGTSSDADSAIATACAAAWAAAWAASWAFKAPVGSTN